MRLARHLAWCLAGLIGLAPMLVLAQGAARPGEGAPPGPGVVAPAKALAPAEQRRRRLDRVHSWSYQLRLIRFPEIAASPFDLVVVDHALAANRRFLQQFPAELVQTAKLKPDGSRRIVLAYLSIGEAERYRFYWNEDWYDPTKKPGWLGAMNPEWEGNYLVRFWDPDWQKIILNGPDSYLARIMEAGFDGIYLDRADAHSDWAKENPDAEENMATFVQKIAAAARGRDTHFLVVMQNAEELLERRPVREAIDAIAKEDLFYGIDHKATPNDPATVDWSLKLLRSAKRAGRRVFVVEYLSEPEQVRDARRRAEVEGFVIHFTTRDLGDLTVIAPDRNPAAPALMTSPPGAPAAGRGQTRPGKGAP